MGVRGWGDVEILNGFVGVVEVTEGLLRRKRVLEALFFMMKGWGVRIGGLRVVRVLGWVKEGCGVLNKYGGLWGV